MSNQIVQSFWYSKNPNTNFISTIEIACVASYLANGHHFHLYTYDLEDKSILHLINSLKECENFKNLSIKNAQEIIKKEEIFFDDRGSVGIAAFSDYFRFALLYQRGGWWVDMDTICLKHLDFSSPFVFASQRNEGGEIMATTCMIKAQKQSVFMHDLLEKAKRLIQEKQRIIITQFSEKTLSGFLLNGFMTKISSSLKKKFFKKQYVKQVPWGIIGPGFLYQILEENPKYKDFICPPSYFCQIDYFKAKDFIAIEDFNCLSESYVSHVWNAMWEAYGLQKDILYPKHSLIEQMRHKYLPSHLLDSLPIWNGSFLQNQTTTSCKKDQETIWLRGARKAYRLCKKAFKK